MTAPHHAAARSMPTEALDSLLSAIATLAAAISDAARYLRARAAMRLRWPSLFPRPRQDESATEWLSRTGKLADPQDAATTSPPVEAAPLPLPGPLPGGQGQPKRDTWVRWQDPPGTPRPVLAVRRDGVIGIDGHGHITVEPASNMHMQDLASSLSATASQPVYTERTPTMPNPALTEPDPYRLSDIVRPWLAFTGDERDRVRWCAEWIRERDEALAARGGTR